MRKIRFGIIGCGLMGRELTSAALRWGHIPEMTIGPEIVSICDTNEAVFGWYRENLTGLRQTTKNYRDLLANPDVQAVYCAVPHHLHETLYCDIISAKKHLLGEKPFGIDKQANEAILRCMDQHPDVLVRCCSEFPFFPAPQQIGNMVESGLLGRIIEVNAGLLHSSDLDPHKPLNWKRQIMYNGQYGCMGDLGIHVCHFPFRAGWNPRNVRAILSNIMQQRPDHTGAMVACDTWDNATLFCESPDPQTGETFPLTLKTQRISPGQTNTWYLEILGTKTSVRYSTDNPKCLEMLEYSPVKRQAWQSIQLGQEAAFKTVTGGIFEFGFSDAFLQMFAAYLYELDNGRPVSRFAGCVLPEETRLSHNLFTAALVSQQHGATVNL